MAEEKRTQPTPGLSSLSQGETSHSGWSFAALACSRVQKVVSRVVRGETAGWQLQMASGPAGLTMPVLTPRTNRGATHNSGGPCRCRLFGDVWDRPCQFGPELGKVTWVNVLPGDNTMSRQLNSHPLISRHRAKPVFPLRHGRVSHTHQFGEFSDPSNSLASTSDCVHENQYKALPNELKGIASILTIRDI